ncbi:MAG: hypothetical protein M1830_010168 [Pleopsidium flavum]|nr:MAG: hypothetical protein M1830_010168 [Pleopsidium flavum]
MPAHRRGPWSQAEDAYLVQLVHTQGAHNWVRISGLIVSRSPKQCRERYHQNLKPSLNHDPITPEEGIVIERLVGEMGKRWAEIARRLRGRSDNAVKNWWNGGMNRRRRLVIRRDGHIQCGDEFDERLQPLSFARPAIGFQRPVRDIMIPPPKRMVEAPLTSPAVSEVSMPDSIDGAPSLVSDSCSSFSTSPMARHSPFVELPPLIGTTPESRRPSFPILHLGTSAFFADAEMQVPNHSTRVDGERKPTLMPLYRRPDVPSESTTREYHYMRHQHSLPIPQQQIKLPSFQALTGQPERLENPDTRMTLSSLLG